MPLIYYVDYIFAKCSQLPQLHIEIQNGMYTFSYRHSRNMQYDIAEHARSADSEKRLVPMTLEHFFFQDGSGDLCWSYPSWLQYFARQPSNLKSLHLGAPCRHITTHTDNHFQQWSNGQYRTYFVQSCPRLETLCLDELDINDAHRIHLIQTCPCSSVWIIQLVATMERFLQTASKQYLTQLLMHQSSTYPSLSAIRVLEIVMSNPYSWIQIQKRCKLGSTILRKIASVTSWTFARYLLDWPISQLCDCIILDSMNTQTLILMDTIHSRLSSSFVYFPHRTAESWMNAVHTSATCRYIKSPPSN